MDNTLDDSIAPGERDAAASPRRHLEVWLPMTIVAVDQATKAIVRSSLQVHESVTIIPGLMDFTHVLNSGAAFGFLNSVDFPFKTAVIAVIATAALIGVGMYAASLAHHQLIARLGLALSIGGAGGHPPARPVPGFGLRFRGLLPAPAPFLGVQRRRLRHLDRRRDHDSRHVRRKQEPCIHV